jgi:hypothetical protein
MSPIPDTQAFQKLPELEHNVMIKSILVVIGTTLDYSNATRKMGLDGNRRESMREEGMKYRIAILAFAALYFGFPPAQVADKSARQSPTDGAPAAAEQTLLQNL